MNCEICKVIQKLGLRKSAHELWLCTDKRMPRCRRRVAIVERTNRRLRKSFASDRVWREPCWTFRRKTGHHRADVFWGRLHSQFREAGRGEFCSDTATKSERQQTTSQETLGLRASVLPWRSLGQPGIKDRKVRYSQ